ncbi:glycine N-acyltransferase-like isoform X2 [Haliotis rubra]|uniref:glycine N-acyltransferase-like isoform X2 n=1 Tax=Haliotis rubra TaxID=36100 RepID=UPI001EE51BA0|nr:glycine N-acyltransferase-like isoform X2 [Haliotis rubra]
MQLYKLRYTPARSARAEHVTHFNLFRSSTGVMAVTLSADLLPEFLSSLGDDARAIHIRGEINSKLCSVITDYDFIVDRWPDYTAAVVRVDSTTAKYPVHLGPLVSVFATQTAHLETLLRQPGVLDWSARIIFVCVDMGAMPAVVKAIDYQQKPYTVDKYLLMTVTRDTLRTRPIPDGFKITSIKPEQASVVNSLWKYNDGKHSEIYIEDIIGKLPSCCLYDADGNMVGFALNYHYGAIGMLHVLPEHRGKGYAKMIMSHLARLCLQQCEEVFVLPEEENEVSIKLQEDIGFKQQRDWQDS